MNRTQGERHLEFWNRVQRRSFVYVIQGLAGGPIKVGWAKDPVKRMATLQCGAYETLHLLHVIPGGRQQEREFHERLKGERCHIGGEWFWGPEADAFRAEIEGVAERMVEACEAGTPAADVTPTFKPGTSDPEPTEETQARWSRISNCWIGGETREQIRRKEDLTETQLEVELLRMRENGYELAEGLQLLQGDDRPISRTGNFRKVGTGRRRWAA